MDFLYYKRSMAIFLYTILFDAYYQSINLDGQHDLKKTSASVPI